MEATIFDIQRNSYVDGPGIRTTVFFKGCNLRCKWCHNPESQNFQKELMFYKNKCTGCGRCRDLTVNDTDFICFNGAKEICGREYTVDEVFGEIIKDKSYYDSSGGGVTFSGGECMLQIDFLTEILKKCKENGIHTAVDTAGNVPWEMFEKILPYTDLFLYDVKCFDSEKHKKYVGTDNETILSNLKKLLSRTAKIHIRIPIIPKVNDSEDEMIKIRDFVSGYKAAVKFELLPYHRMGEHKYGALGRDFVSFEVPSAECMEELKRVFL